MREWQCEFSFSNQSKVCSFCSYHKERGWVVYSPNQTVEFEPTSLV